MTNSKNIVYVGIDIAKRKNDVQVELPNNKRQRFTVVNRLEDFERLGRYLSSLRYDCEIGLEASGNYHRLLAYYLQVKGF